MTSVLLSLAMVVCWGTWIPIAQAVPGLQQATRTFYVTTGNLVFAAIALVAGGSAGQLSFGWKEFWLPLAGGLVWTAGNVCAFRATELIGLARASGTWTPLNIIVAFVFGALLFNELSGFSALRYVLLAGCLALVLAGVFLIIGSQGSPTAADPIPTPAADPPSPQSPSPPPSSPPVPTRPLPPSPSTSSPLATTTITTTTASALPQATAAAPASAFAPDPAPTSAPAATLPISPTYHRGLLYAMGAGLLWGAYFVPAQWAHVPSQLGNFPLAIGMFAAAVILAARERAIVRLTPRHTAIQLGAGLLFGVGSVALLGLVPRVGTGVGFTIAQLSLLVNAGAGIWIFKVPAPGTRAARIALTGILLAGIGGTAIGALR